MTASDDMMKRTDDIRVEYKNKYIREFGEYNRGMRRKFHIVTFGCQMNENDSERIAGMLSEMGYAESDSIAESDIVVFNTCCVRKSAEDKIYGRIGALKGLKKERPSVIIAVGGCMAQQGGTAEIIKRKYPHVDILFGTHDMHELPRFFYERVFTGVCGNVPAADTGYVVEGIPAARHDSLRAYVTVSFGCSNHCSYCIVPSVRGAERSRRMDDILLEIRTLAENGTREIILLGQNVNSYGTDIYGKTAFSDLLREIDKIGGLERIRFMTSHPKDLTDSLIEAMRDCGKVCGHLHLPLQAGSDRVLELMNRKYTQSDYLGLISRLRGEIPGISVTTDIIVGFPGETEEDFLETLDVVSRVRFDTAYTFLYSVRKGTDAEKLPGMVPQNVIKERFDRLVAIQNEISRDINESLVGTEADVLVEGLSKTDRRKLTGRTRTNKIVNFTADGNLTGRLVTVRIERAGTWSLEGSYMGT